jgi:hypothetical protein
MSLTEPLEATPSTPKPPSRRGVWIAVIAVLLLVVIVLRECGVDLNLYGWNTSTKMEFKFDTSRSTLNRRPVDLRQANLTVHVEPGPGGTIGTAAAERLEQMRIAGAGPYQGRLTIRLQKADLKGAYFLPLYKPTECDFTATYRLTAEGAGSSVAIDGQLNGHLDGKVTGMCSVHKLQQLVGQEIAGQIENHIRTLINKAN